MLCEHAKYTNDTGDNRAKLLCTNTDNDVFDGMCPLIYWCPISEKFENTTDMFDCIYRRKKSDR